MSQAKVLQKKKMVCLCFVSALLLLHNLFHSIVKNTFKCIHLSCTHPLQFDCFFLPDAYIRTTCNQFNVSRFIVQLFFPLTRYNRRKKNLECFSSFCHIASHIHYKSDIAIVAFQKPYAQSHVEDVC